MFRPIMQFALAILLGAWSATIPAEAADVAPKVVTAPEVKKMRDEGKLIVHTLSRIEYNIQHIPGSINIPAMEVETSEKMPKDKAAPIVFYCAGPECFYSKVAAIKSMEIGYSNVLWFQGGIAEWRKMQYELDIDKNIIGVDVPMISPADANALIGGKDVFVLDVIPKWNAASLGNDAFAHMAVGTSANIPLMDLDQKLSQLPKDKKILITDAYMMQAMVAGKYLKAQGYNVIGAVKGGLNRWIAEGLPVVERPKGP